MADNIYLVMARFYGDFDIPYEIPIIAIDNGTSARKIENILKNFCKKYNPNDNDIPFTDFQYHWSEIYEKLDKFLDNADIEIFKERINTVCDNPCIYALHSTFFVENLFEIQCTNNTISVNKKGASCNMIDHTTSTKHYYDFGYFFSRKDSGSLRVTTETELDTEDIDFCIKYACDNNLIDKSYADNIIYVEELSESDARDMGFFDN